ncbi:hypothetical protein A3742_08685 [Oleiphilus sp. HI0071]|jgi:MSHA biogenesis protein MshO|uniref:prepilin-type N-terminal cleavage/methylation domain-containing protein n=2 Tax=Oleiphilus TaxID=141450 RepID=UPI0007C3580D|nr:MULTISPECIES: prepilin-type N-terminal cleavage/methylation domain-containing protein [unclassified Oleiphilus]KZY74639.1 hypothetical protein A3737_08765 [Oleiphilus sp. HI0065]KZY82744.1 hypothetical protein A3742_08685 [Oleiphilus sp. HI0071]KZZ05539.1 hypothetical protein A3744_08110 [Oleiphilus sp. HI0073]KZZ50262.1 hypothetical protein A3760_20265 [Oleiphilus sp. HI0122]KZZ74863.1 hypothetical protein A3767_03475 [Oleiphilus sp. HI0133]KZZ77317.1 hypothetical protein A3765_09005 [Ole
MQLGRIGVQRGFTLIEIIVTIVIIGILGVGIVNFIGRSVQGVADSADRQHIASIAWLLSEKVSRGVRDALPNSFRVNAASGSGSCIEYIPTVGGSDYLTVPTAGAADSFEVVPFPNYTAGDVDSARDRVAVYPNTVSGLYSLASPGTISSLVSQLTAGATPNALELELSAAHQFLTDSPTRRFYIVRPPEMFCFVGGFLNYYTGYGFQSSIPDPSGLTPQVVASQLRDGAFAYSPGTLSRAGVVILSFDVVDASGAVQSIAQEIQVRNVP